MTRDQLAARITRRYDKIIADLEQAIRDVTWWNQNRVDAALFDCGAERVLLVKERAARAAWREQLADDNPETREKHTRLCRECTEFAERHFVDDLDTE